MKQFIIMNGKDISLHEFISKEKAIIYCQNFLDHSKEIILREINYDRFTDHIKIFVNID